MNIKSTSINKWLQFIPLSSIELNALFDFHDQVSLTQKDNIYYKVFTPKDKNQKFTILYFATEGSTVVSKLMERFKLIECNKPDRKLLTRIAGFTADRPWML